MTIRGLAPGRRSGGFFPDRPWRTAHRAGRPAPASVTGGVLKFAVSGFVAVAIVGVAAAFVIRGLNTNDALDDVRDVSEVVGRGTVAPLVTDAFIQGDPGAIQAMDTIVRQRVLNERLVRVKIWKPDGRILYSDEARLIGQSFILEPAQRSAVDTGLPHAELSDLTAPENRYELSGLSLFEVYVPLHSPSGQAVLFEAYIAGKSADSGAGPEWTAIILPVALGVVLLELIQVPLAFSMGRRILRGQKERETLLRRAIEASDAERRRIVGGIHDGVVQNLAGLSYALEGMADEAGPDAPAELRSGLRAAAADARDNISQVRRMLMDIYPPNIQGAGLKAALADLLAPLAARGVATTCEIPDNLALSTEHQVLFFRVARESLQNVSKHAHATAASVHIVVSPARVVMTIEDNGRGFSPAEAKRRQDEGHIGLQILEDLVSYAGGQQTVTSAPGRGTRVRLEVAVA